MGSAWSPEEENQGVIPSVMDELFTRVEHEPNTDFTIKVSFVEIHKVCSRCCSVSIGLSCSTAGLMQWPQVHPCSSYPWIY
jgi:hypothetical protein